MYVWEVGKGRGMLRFLFQIFFFSAYHVLDLLLDTQAIMLKKSLLSCSSHYRAETDNKQEK